MRLCGRMRSDGSLNAVEISYITYDLVDDDGTDLGPGVRLKAVDTEGDQWFVYNVPREEADNIIEAITRHGWVILSSEYLLTYMIYDEDDADDEDSLN